MTLYLGKTREERYVLNVGLLGARGQARFGKKGTGYNVEEYVLCYAIVFQSVSFLFLE